MYDYIGVFVPNVKLIIAIIEQNSKYKNQNIKFNSSKINHQTFEFNLKLAIVILCARI